MPPARRSRLSGLVDTVTPARRHKPDYWLLILSALLLTIGLVVVYSISPGLAASQHISQNFFVTKQLISVGLGVLGFIVAAYTPVKTWQQWAKPLAIAAIVGGAGGRGAPGGAAEPARRGRRRGGF